MFLSLLLTGCTWIPKDLDRDGFPVTVDCDDRDGRSTVGGLWFSDEDGDGHGSNTFEGIFRCQSPGPEFVQTNGDCDDSDPAVHPDALELAGDDADDDCDGSWLCFVDADGDSWGTHATAHDTVPCTQSSLASIPGDCDDADAATYPHAEERCDGADNDCDGVLPSNEVDADGDGFAVCEGTAPFAGGDCDDAAAQVFPGAAEACDGIDNDCDGDAPGEEDTDGDGFRACAGDCDDTSAHIHPNATELAGDDVDENCDGAWLCYLDLDADGFGSTLTDTATQPCSTSTLASVPTDCDDHDAFTHPLAAERCDGIDNDCDGALPDDEVDGDGDGFVACEGVAPFDGGDCDDTQASVFPGAAEACDGIDSNCDGFSDEQDTDADGFRLCDGDCDDTSAHIHPNATELAGNDIDENCDGAWLCYLDIDQDGFGSTLTQTDTQTCSESTLASDPTDCDDNDDFSHPQAFERCDGVDNDCDLIVPAEEIDHDLDGYVACTWSGSSTGLGDDCDDTAAFTYPGAPELCDGTDNDCNPFTSDQGRVSIGTTLYPTLQLATDAVGTIDVCGGTTPHSLVIDRTTALLLEGRTVDGLRPQIVRGSLPDRQIHLINAPLTVRGIDFFGGARVAVTGGCVRVEADDVELVDVGFYGCESNFSGGALRVDDGNLTVHGSRFEGNIAATRSAGALRCNDCPTVLISDSFFSHNAALASSGGAIRIRSQNITIESSDFISNQAQVNGGGMSLVNNQPGVPGQMILQGLNFQYNHAESAGGGLHISTETGVFARLTNSTFVENTSVLGGGGFYGQLGTGGLMLANLDLMENHAGASGGALYLLGGVVTADNLQCDANSSMSSGGAVYASDNLFTLQNSLLTNNTSATGGGALRLNESDFTCDHSDFMTNETGGNGGAIFALGGDTTLQGCTLDGNNAGASGGGLYSNTSNIELNTGTFITNNTAALGGGMYLLSLDTTAQLRDSTFRDNRATGPLPRGGALMLHSSSVDATNCLFEAGGWAESEGGIHLNTANSTLVLTDSTVRDFEQGVRILAGNLVSTHTTWEQNTVDVRHGNAYYQATPADFLCDGNACSVVP